MTIQSLGVGSGLALDDLVTQLIQAERKPKEDRLNAREETLDNTISGLGKLKSKLEDFLDSVDELRNDSNLQGREPTITNPDENTEPFTAEASNSAVKGDYEIAVTKLASGSRFETADGAFASNTSEVLSTGDGNGNLTFSIGATGDTFSIAVTEGMTLQQVRNAVNNATDNFGVNASIINTGTVGGGAKLVFTSSTTGTGNDLSVTNDNAALDPVSTNLTTAKNAQNAQAIIDGIVVESETNTFENTIENVSFEAQDISIQGANGVLAPDGNNYETSTLSIGFDKEGLDKKIRDFVDDFNSLSKEIASLTRYGTTELEEDGVLAGDSLVRGIQSGLANIISSSNDNSALGSLFAIGVELNSDGELEISNTDFGLGTGESRLKDALEDNFDDVAALFTDNDKGIASRLYEYVREFTRFSGILSVRERSAKDDKDQLASEREQFELRMLSYEQLLKDKYTNLDQTVARLNQTGNALFASLNGL
ncbi:flagellar filament capping protein FliD [Aestuariibacter salexigens]|uniref:flagellar filament capping protein FliD n=1 Tax=Aestuariibacter salexigens TaxID=226010 RepID=UPI00041CFE65|nr:flagellar filament capping protein FliD [Aestuariibacter salexigens]